MPHRRKRLSKTLMSQPGPGGPRTAKHAPESRTERSQHESQRHAQPPGQAPEQRPRPMRHVPLSMPAMRDPPPGNDGTAHKQRPRCLSARGVRLAGARDAGGKPRNDGSASQEQASDRGKRCHQASTDKCDLPHTHAACFPRARTALTLFLSLSPIPLSLRQVSTSYVQAAPGRRPTFAAREARERVLFV